MEKRCWSGLRREKRAGRAHLLSMDRLPSCMYVGYQQLRPSVIHTSETGNITTKMYQPRHLRVLTDSYATTPISDMEFGQALLYRNA